MPMHLTSHTAPRRQTGAAALRPVVRWSLAAIAGAWLLVAGQAHASVIIQRSLSIGLDNGLVGWWTFDGKDVSGAVGGATPRQVYDRSGTGKVGKYYNGTTTPPAIGKIGQTLEFDGANDYVTAGNAGSGIKTIAFWMKAPDVTSKKIINIDGTDQIETNGSDQIVATSFPASAVYVDGVPASAVQDNKWHHVLITDTTGVSASTFEIGRVSSVYFPGLIDDVRIYNRALSADEIKRLYNMGGTVKLNTTFTSLTNGLVGWWTFDGKDVSGDVGGATPRQIYDRSGSGNVVKYWNATATPPVIGKIGQGMELDGVDDYVEEPSFSSDLSSSDYTASLWVRCTCGTVQTPLSIRTSGNSNGETVVITVQGTLNQAIARMNGVQVALSSANVNDGAWHLLTAVRSGTTLSLYVDAVQKASGTMNATNSGTHNLIIGNNSSGPPGPLSTQWFNGDIDDVRVYSRALSADEIKRLYNMGGTVKLNSSQNLNNNNSLQNGLVGWWTFDGKDISGVQAYDRSGNGNRGILTSGPVQTIGKIGQGLSFDGVNDYVALSNEASFDFTGAFTFSVWFYVRAWDISHQAIIAKGDTSWRLARDGVTSKLTFETGGLTSSLFDTTATIATGQWYHVVGLWTGTVKHLYVNGSLDNSQNSTGTLTNNAFQVYIGENAEATGRNFDGLIDDVRIYNRALSADEVKRLYNMGR